MSDRAFPLAAVLAAGIGMGVAGDQLLRASGGPGLNFFLLFVGLATSVWVVARTGGKPLSREASVSIAVGLLFGAALLWRGSQLLRFWTFLAACVAFALPALHAGRGWIRRSGVVDVLEAVVGAGLHSAFGSVRMFGAEHWGGVVQPGSSGSTRALVRTVGGGALLAFVPLLVFGALFASADPVFATIIGDFFEIDLHALAAHVLATAVLSWLACGYLIGVSSGTRLSVLRRVRPSRPSLGISEVATALGLVDLLFLGFVIVQFRYLFGGGAWVEVTPGLTYAAYARAGFFQLVAAVALAIPWLLLTHALLREERGRGGRHVFRGFAGVHLLLLLAIVASAIQRMLAYQSAFGLTELRVVVTAALAWLTLIVVWFGATVLSGRRDRFAFGALVTAFFLVGALQVLNPAGLVARHNLDRSDALVEVDAEYLGSLGSDAAPLLVARIGELPDQAQCVVANQLIRRWGPDRPPEWKSFNWSEARAREAVGNGFDALQDLLASHRCDASD